MSRVARFEAYADDFEVTYVDDDWSRLEQYFTEDVIYARRSSRNRFTQKKATPPTTVESTIETPVPAKPRIAASSSHATTDEASVAINVGTPERSVRGRSDLRRSGPATPASGA